MGSELVQEANVGLVGLANNGVKGACLGQVIWSLGDGALLPPFIHNFSMLLMHGHRVINSL